MLNLSAVKRVMHAFRLNRHPRLGLLRTTKVLSHESLLAIVGALTGTALT